jgi:hypothetical protein
MVEVNSMGDFDEFLPYRVPRVDKVNSKVLEAFTNLAQEFYQTTGEPLSVTDSFRTYEEQASAHASKPKLALPAGSSRHEVGDALDIDQGQIAKLGVGPWQEMLGRHGFTLPALSKGETWHIELSRGEQKAEKIAAKVSVPDDFAEFLPKKVPENDFAAFMPKAEAAAPQVPEEPIVDAGLPEATFSQVPDPIKTALGGAATTGARGVATVLGAPHEYITKPLIEKPLDYLLQKAGVPTTQETPMGAMLTPGEFGQVGGPPIEGTIQAPLRDLAVTGAGLAADLPVYGALSKIARLLTPSKKLGELIPPVESAGPSLESQLKEGIIQAYANKSYPPFPLSEKLTPLTTEKYISALNRENEASIALAPTQWSREKGKFMYGGGPSTEEIKAFAQNALNEGAPLLTVVGQVANKFKISPEAAYSALKGGLSSGKTISPPTLGVVPTSVPTSMADLKPVADIDARVLGEFSLEPKPYQFDRLDKVMPGTKDTVYWPQKLNEKLGLEEVQAIEKTNRALESSLPKGSSEAIMLNAIARQKGGPDVLKAMGIENLPKLLPEQEAALGQFRTNFDNLFVRFNEARVAAGKEPINKVENYFTFFRRLEDARKDGLNILTEKKEFFNPRVGDLDYSTRRVKSDLPLVTDAFKVFRNYVREVVPWIHEAPHLAEVANLSKSLLETQPNLSFALGRWVNNIQGIDIPRRLGALDAPLGNMVKHVSSATLGGNVSSALTQPFSLVETYTMVGPKHFAIGLAKSLNPAEIKRALNVSTILKTRNFDVSVADSMERMISDNLAKQARRGVTAASYIPLKSIDAKAAQVTWLSAESRAIAHGMDDPIKYADDIVLKTQGSGALSDISDIQTHTTGKFLTMFQTFVINNFKFLAKDVLGIKNPDLTKREQLRRVINYVVGAGIANSVADEIGMPTPIPSPIKAAQTSLNKGERGLDVVKAAGLELAQKLPIIGGRARFGSSSILGPGASFVENALSGQESLPIVAGKLAGIPGTNQFRKLLPMLSGDEESNVENWKAALLGRTQEQYEERRGSVVEAPEKRFMKGLREPIDNSIEDLLDLMGR